MQTAAMTSRFLTGCSSKVGLADSELLVSRDSLLRHIVASHLVQTVHSQQVFIKLTNELIRFAEQALILRDLDALEEVSQTLMGLPVDTARKIGLYYRALAINRRGQGDEADAVFHQVADEGPITYRARAIQTLGVKYHCKGQYDEALRFQLEALRAASDRKAQSLQTTLLARWEISIIRNLEGDHKGALADFRSLAPVVNLAAKQNPFYFYAYCNDLAVVLGELGRVAEAERASETALASPYASVYPNWTETRQELEAKCTSAMPSVVAVNKPSEDIPAPQTQPQPCLARSQPLQVRKRAFAFCWLSSRGTFQRAFLSTAGFSAISNRRTNCNTLEQLGKCIKSRAPPTTN